MPHQLLERAGFEELVERVISIDEMRAWKPAPDPYRHAADVVRGLPGRLAPVAVHLLARARRRSGLVIGWASRLGGRFPAVFDRPDVFGSELVEVVEGLPALREAP